MRAPSLGRVSRVLYERVRHASSGAGTSASSPSKPRQVVKKKYGELPTALLLEHGAIAAPLPEWTGMAGGLNVPVKPKVKRKTKLIDPGEADAISVKRRKSIKKDPSSSVKESLDQTSPATPHTLKPKRGRKKLVAEETTASIMETPLTSSSVQKDTFPQTQLARDILYNLNRFPGCILLTRVGQFYESYFDQATEVARILGIKLTSRSWGGSRVPMCGFPLAHLDRHLKTLVAQGQRFVALCEEFRSFDGTFERRVVRVVTPGTLIDESFVNHYENNYLLAISFSMDPEASGTTIGLAWIDVSTGDFFTQSSSPDTLRDDIARIGPREIVFPESLRDQSSHPIRMVFGNNHSMSITYLHPEQDTSAPHGFISSPAIDESILPSALTSPLGYSGHESQAINLLTKFLHTHLLESMPTLTSPTRQSADTRMQIDSHTIDALEIKEAMREGGVTGSLMSTIKRTLSSGGTRLLARWLCSPSTSIPEINARQSLVAIFRENPFIRQDLSSLLRSIEDISRIVQKFLLQRGSVDDLAAIKGTIEDWVAIKERMTLEVEGNAKRKHGDATNSDWSNLSALTARIIDLSELSQRIGMAVDTTALRRRSTSGFPADEGRGEAELDELPEEMPEMEAEDAPMLDIPSERRMGTTKSLTWTIRPAFSPELQDLHDRRQHLLISRSELEIGFREIFDAPSLTLRSTGPHGLHVHIGKVKRDDRLISKSDKAISIGRSNSTRAYFVQDWAVLGSQIIETENALFLAERRAFELLRREVNACASALRRNARIMDELDVTLAFADLAVQMNFVRPTLNDGVSYNVVDGRHPTVELGLLDSGRTFVPNSVQLVPSSRLHIITGPNMSGKSSLLRQTALIAILAQVGSFVPATSATIGIVDAVFSRVGAKDDLYRDRSTFMVEMLETAEILKRATSKSLVIMDEVGRGTTVKDGIAIAFATVHYLDKINGCRALFSTHLHEIVDLLGYDDEKKGPASGSDYPHIGFFSTGVDETPDGHFAYSHRLVPGVNRDSHGLKVARLAGMPALAINLASATLEKIRAGGGIQQGN